MHEAIALPIKASLAAFTIEEDPPSLQETEPLLNESPLEKNMKAYPLLPQQHVNPTNHM